MNPHVERVRDAHLARMDAALKAGRTDDYESMLEDLIEFDSWVHERRIQRIDTNVNTFFYLNADTGEVFHGQTDARRKLGISWCVLKRALLRPSTDPGLHIRKVHNDVSTFTQPAF